MKIVGLAGMGLGLVLTLATARAQEDRWKYIGMGADDSVISIDTTTIRRPYSGYVDVWVQYLRTPKSRTTFDATPQAKAMHRLGINCEGMTMGTIAQISHDADGNVTQSSSTATPSYAPIAPDTVGEMIRNAACQLPP